jgi:cytochrome c
VKRFPIVAILVALLAAGANAAAVGDDPAAGETAFKACRVCHQIGENARNFVGPELNGVYGRPAGIVPGYNYSDAMKHSEIVWDEATLTKFLHKPREVVPGTKMAFPGFASDSEIANVIGYLRAFGPDGKKM